jgi:membrane-associated phospholipid phosphatase
LGFWYERVLEAVNGAGAQKDIFPSLHTGGPTVCFLFALRHRKTSPFKYTWVVTGFFAANIIIATMFLRWHYLIDIIAGLTLATLASVAAAAIANWEHNVRLQRALQPVWFHLLPARKPSASLDTSSESQATS